MIEALLLVLVFVCGQNLSLGKNGFLVAGVHYRIVRRKMDNGTEEEFLDCRLGISSN